jgi:hypothetical protein
VNVNFNCSAPNEPCYEALLVNETRVSTSFPGHSTGYIREEKELPSSRTTQPRGVILRREARIGSLSPS